MNFSVKQRIGIIIGFLVLQIIVFVGIRYSDVYINESSGRTEEKQLRQQSDYKTLALLTGKTDTIRSQASVLKMGNIQVWTGTYGSSWGMQPEWWTLIAKAGHMLNKKDFDSAHQILSNAKAKDTRIVSLVLALRAQLYCNQRMWTECAILARDSVILDPFAPLGYMLKGIAYRNQREYEDAKLAFDQYISLSGELSPEFLFNRGITYYYTRDRELSKLDLEQITGHPLYGYEATIFLGRNHFDTKDYAQSLQTFQRAQEKNSTGAVLSYLRLGRVSNKMNNPTQAMKYYQQGYDLFPNNIELVTDIMQLASKQNDFQMINNLKNAITMAAGNSPYSHELAGRRYREIGQTELSEKFLRLGISHLPSLSGSASYETQSRGLYNQLHSTLIQHIFNNYNGSGKISSRYKEIDTYNLNEAQTTFTKQLQTSLFGMQYPLQVSKTFTGRLLSADELEFAKARYYILTDNYSEAKKTIDEIPLGQGNDINVLWLRAAYYLQQENTDEAYKYINGIREGGYLAKLPTGEPETEFWVWQQAFKPFRPRIHRLIPYLSPEKLID